MDLKYKIALFLHSNRLFKKIFTPLAAFILKKLQGRTNVVVFIKKDGTRVYNKKNKKIRIVFKAGACNNRVEIYEPYLISSKLTLVFEGSSNTFKLGANSRLHSLNISFGNDNTFVAGENFTVVGLKAFLIRSNGKKITIGSNCMFSFALVFRTSDAHSVYDNQTKQVLNPPDNIEIGNHVWIAANSTILKGVKIPDNCIIGAQSVVNKKFDKPNCIIAGIPAGVKKENINWSPGIDFQWEGVESE